jgi:catechol 2,3-dioxygenase-like lactoylglutathione lyase family enzyme
MTIRGLVWLGTRSERFSEAVAFHRDVLGLELVHLEPDFAVFRLPDTSLVEVFGPSSPYGKYHRGSPVAGFLVDDVEAARDELERKGVRLIGPIERSEDFTWQYFEGPDGNLYEVTSGPYRTSETSDRSA